MLAIVVIPASTIVMMVCVLTPSSDHLLWFVNLCDCIDIIYN